CGMQLWAFFEFKVFRGIRWKWQFHARRKRRLQLESFVRFLLDHYYYEYQWDGNSGGELHGSDKPRQSFADGRDYCSSRKYGIEVYCHRGWQQLDLQLLTIVRLS